MRPNSPAVILMRVCVCVCVYCASVCLCLCVCVLYLARSCSALSEKTLNFER